VDAYKKKDVIFDMKLSIEGEKSGKLSF